MPEEIVNASQSDDIKIEQDAATEALFDSFNIKPSAAQKEIKFPEKGDITEEEEEDPAIDQEISTDVKKLKVKHDHKEVEVDEKDIPDLVEKGMNLDKVRAQKTDLEKTLERAAKLEGLSVPDYIASLEVKEKNQAQEQQTKLDDMKADMLDQLESAGYDRKKAEEWVDNHPLFVEGKKALELNTKASEQAKEIERWEPLYKEYPAIREAASKNEWDWITPELSQLIARGNDPLLAYEHLNKATVQTQTKKQMEQKLIKQQQLGNRSNTLGNTSTEEVTSTLLPAQRALAELFGVSEQGVEKQQKFINSRR